MKRIVYSVAMSLDGYIAGPKGEADWIIMDPDIDFGEIFAAFDTVLMGRRSFEPMADSRNEQGVFSFSNMKTFVFSRTLKPGDHPGVHLVGENFTETLTSMKEAPGKDIWLFGGGLLFQSLAEAGLVDAVEIGVIPVLLGEGIPLLPSPAARINLKLTGHEVYEKSGIVGLKYAVS